MEKDRPLSGNAGGGRCFFNFHLISTGRGGADAACVNAKSPRRPSFLPPYTNDIFDGKNWQTSHVHNKKHSQARAKRREPCGYRTRK
jgi:hypothetical protein